MDTDSLIMEIKTADVYADVKNNLINGFDTSDYPKDNDYGMPLVNKKVLGKFKYELNGKIMKEFFGLRSKLYAHKVFENEKETKKAKGIKNIIQKEISFEDFKTCLLTENPIYKKQSIFKSNLHDIFTTEQNKKALSAHDDKRFILDNGINILAWGHHQIKVEIDQFLNHLKNLLSLCVEIEWYLNKNLGKYKNDRDS